MWHYENIALFQLPDQTGILALLQLADDKMGEITLPNVQMFGVGKFPW